MMGRKEQQRRMYISILLLAVLMPVYVITTLHHHDAPLHLQECVACNVHHHHIHKNHLETSDPDSSQNCYICHFVFSPVEKAHSFEVSFCHDFVNVSYSDVLTSVGQSVIRCYSLRAPPSATILA